MPLEQPEQPARPVQRARRALRGHKVILAKPEQPGLLDLPGQLGRTAQRDPPGLQEQPVLPVKPA